MFKLDTKSDADALLCSLSHPMGRPHGAHAHSVVSVAPADQRCGITLLGTPTRTHTHTHSVLVTGTQALTCCVCPFPWCKYPHMAGLRLAHMKPPNMDLG